MTYQHHQHRQDHDSYFTCGEHKDLRGILSDKTQLCKDKTGTSMDDQNDLQEVNLVYIKHIRLFRQVTDFQSFLRSKPHIDQQILDRLPSSKQRLRSSTSVNLRPMPKHLTPLAPRCRSQSWTQSPRTLDSDSESTSTFYKYRIYQNILFF